MVKGNTSLRRECALCGAWVGIGDCHSVSTIIYFECDSLECELVKTSFLVPAGSLGRKYFFSVRGQSHFLWLELNA